MNHTDKHGEWRSVAVHLFKVNDSMLLKGRTSCLRPCSSRTHVHDNDWGSWDNAASDLVGVRGPAFALLLALRPYFESERNLEMNTHLRGRQSGHMLRLQLCQPLFYKIHSFPSPSGLTKQALDTCKNQRKCIRDWKGDRGKISCCQQIYHPTVQIGVLTHRWTPPQTVGRTPCPEEDSPSPQPEEIRPVDTLHLAFSICPSAKWN